MRNGCLRALTAAVLVAWLGLGPGPLAAAEPDELDQRIARLISQLGDKEFAVRQRAQQELSRLGFAAFDALSDAEESDDIEIATQAQYLVRLIRTDWTSDNAPPQVRQILKEYDFQNESTRLARMKQLLDLPGDAGLDWLCRLVRFEQSPVLSKQAALLIIGQEPQPDAAAWQKRIAAINKNLDRSQRPAARWLKTYSQMRVDPAAALDQWTQLVEAEKQVLDEHPQQSDNRVLMQLLRIEVAQLEALKRDDEALRAMHNMVALERGDPQTLGELVGWLAKRHAWPVIDDVAKRFASSFEADPQLLYTLAQALAEEGKREQADETAQKALRISPEKAGDHFEMARSLQSRGLYPWADQEYRHVISLMPAAPDKALWARRQLAENLHDRQQDLEAAEVLKGALEAIDGNPQIGRLVTQKLGWELDGVRSRVSFLYACDFGRKNDHDKERELLEKGIEQDPNDADVLIALFHLPNQDAEGRQKTLDLIKLSVQSCRNQIDEEPDMSTPYNQLAWLVANTEGDFDEALRMSLKSIELVKARIAQQESVRGQSDTFVQAWMESLGGHLDTLAHCYAAKEDFENAAKTQAEAYKLIPHSQQIARKLESFRKRAAEQPPKDEPPSQDSP